MIINATNQTDLTGFYVVFEGSTLLERKGIRGISHLMEHLQCKNLEHLEESFDRDGVLFNAYTSSNEIVFYLQGLDDRVLKYKDDFVNLITEFKITEDDFLKEKKIVIEEYYDSFNDQSSSHYMNLFRKIYDDYTPIGCINDLNNMTFDDIKEFYKLQYSKPSKIINISKNNMYFNDSIEFNNIKIDKKMSIIDNNNYSYQESNEYKDKSSIMLTSKVVDIKDVRICKVINLMLSYGLISPLYKEVRENEGLVYYISSSNIRYNNDSINYIMTSTSNENVTDVLKSIKLVLDNPDKYMTSDRLEVIKDYLKVRRLKSDINLYKNVSRFIEPIDFEIDESVDTLTIDDVMKVYNKYYRFDDYRASIDKSEF